jgi:hypothetical protein
LRTMPKSAGRCCVAYTKATRLFTAAFEANAVPPNRLF